MVVAVEGKYPTPCKKEGEMSGRGNVRGECPTLQDAITASCPELMLENVDKFFSRLSGNWASSNADCSVVYRY